MDGGEGKDESRLQPGEQKRIRRLWSAQDKRRIMREAGRPGVVMQRIAEHHGVHVSVLNRWRREVGVGTRRTRAKQAESPARLVSVQVSRPAPRPRTEGRPLAATTASMAGDLIEVVFPAGQLVTVRGAVNGDLLRAVLRELSQC